MWKEAVHMKKSKVLLTVLIVMLHCIAAFAAPAKDAKYSVDAAEIEYDMKSGDGTTTGKTTIKHDQEPDRPSVRRRGGR